MAGNFARRRFLIGSSAAALGSWWGLAKAAQAEESAGLTRYTVRTTSSQLILGNDDESVYITVLAPDVVHVVAAPARRGPPAGASALTPWIATTLEAKTPDIVHAEDHVAMRTPKLSVEFNLKSGLLRMLDSRGALLLQECPRVARRYVPQAVNGEDLYRVEQRFYPEALESIYGLGQHQDGVFDQRGAVVELAQTNANVAIPFFVSTAGYGLMWNTASKSWFDNRFPTELKLTAEAADAIDYYVFYGPSIDRIIEIYRDLTGQAPLFPRWAYGFIQSKDRYRSARELLNVVQEYRERQAPLDVIVQDWFWWKRQGDPDYAEDYLAQYPDVPGAIKKLQAANVHPMISVWAKFDPNSHNYQQMLKLGLLIPGTDIYDATNPAARDYYWKNLIGVKFAEGWDAFWLDSSEPEIWNGQSDAVLEALQLFIGNGARYTNIFPLMHCGGVHDHWRQSTERKRVFILTRSAFLGQQRYATAVWSGDVIGTWMTFRRQIAAGLNYQMSGLPYWTTDIAGYGWPYERDTKDPDYQELYVRWFQFGVFCPLLRTHGHRSNDTNELFSYGSQTQTLVSYDELRHRLLPYIYSLAWRVMRQGYTLQRALPMDWPEDLKVRQMSDQFMFGPAFLVAPVTEPGATLRAVYLPRAAGWYDFWTGERLVAGATIEAPAPLHRIPVYARSGSIVPLGPSVQNADSEIDTLEIRVYPGADGDFEWYSDAGDGYDYEHGARRIVPMHWDDAARILTLGGSTERYPTMPKRLHVRLIIVRDGYGVGGEVTDQSDAEALYVGAALKLKPADCRDSCH